MQLRPYQEKAIDEYEEMLAMGIRAPLMVAPTGAGKTIIAAEIIRRARDKGENVLFLAPRRELVHQTRKKLLAIGVHHGVMMAGAKNLQRFYEPVQVGSVDTLLARMRRGSKQLDNLPRFDRLIIDEAHVGVTEARERLFNLWPYATLLGLTATPCRSDGKALGRIYDELIEVAQVADLVKQGYLVDADYYSVSEPDLRKVRTTAGDYNKGDLGRVMNRPKLVGDIVGHWLEHASDRRTVVFASSIDHSAALAHQFMLMGVAAEHVDANTPTAERERIFERFSSGRTQVLTNCMLASIGFDLPELDCVVFARPTKSLGLYIQMIGRGLRTAPGKERCLVLDHAGNVMRHGFATETRYWTLHGKYAEDEVKKELAKKEKEERELMEVSCPECHYVFEASPECPNCGYVFPKKGRVLETLDGQLIPLNMKRKDEIDDYEFYLQLAGYAKIKDYKPGWIAHKFKEKFKRWPDRAWANDAKLYPITPTNEVLRWIQSRQIAWARSQKKYAGKERAAFSRG